ncbi:MAG: DUF1820 family protein [Oligoflexales bacterium]
MKQEKIYRVRFVEKDQKEPIEALVKSVEPSDFTGLVCFKDFVFRDQTKKIILPEEEAASKRFHKTLALHIPYHNILFVEELYDEPVDYNSLAFLKSVESSP